MDKGINIPQGYKNSSLGVIPKEWEVKRLGEISKVNQGLQIPISERLVEHVPNSFKYITIQFLNGAKETEYILNPNESVVCNEEDVLMTRTGNTGIVVSGVKGVFHNNFFKINYDREVLSKKYLIEFLTNKRTQHILLVKAGTSTIPDLNHKDFYSIHIPLPPLSEQQKIAEILSCWDEAIEKQTRLIEKLEIRKRGLMQQLLTGKKRLKGFEGEWKKTKAGNIFQSISVKGNNNEELLSATQDRGIIPRYMLDGRVTMPSNDTNSFKLVEIGDFVISLRTFQGGIEYSYYRGIVSPAYTVLKPKTRIDKEYYKYYFKSYDFIGHLSIAVIGIRDGKQISFDDFCSVSIPNPSLSEQTAIANILSTADEEIQKEKEKLAVLKSQKKGLMQQLLTGKKRVKI